MPQVFRFLGDSDEDLLNLSWTAFPGRNWERFKHIFPSGESFEIPGYIELAEIIMSLPPGDNDALDHFRKDHHQEIIFLRDLVESPEFKQLKNYLQETAELLNFSFTKLFIDDLRCLYYENLFARTIINPRLLETQARGSKVNSARQKIQNFEETCLNDSDYLAKFSRFYAASADYYEKFRKRVLISFDPKIIELKNKMNSITTVKVHLDPGIAEQRKSQALFLCRFCHNPSYILRGRGVGVAPVHCGREECMKAYKLENQRKNRQAKRSAWQSTRKRSDCLICGEKLVVNVVGICKPCFETHLGQ